MNDGGGGREHGALAGVPLFRPEVLRNRQSEWLGTILVTPRALGKWFPCSRSCCGP